MHCLRLANCQVYFSTVRDHLARTGAPPWESPWSSPTETPNFSFDPMKIDRSDLYGFKEVEVLDEHGQRCELATLADDGKTVVGRGGVTYAYLAPTALGATRAV